MEVVTLPTLKVKVNENETYSRVSTVLSFLFSWMNYVQHGYINFDYNYFSLHEKPMYLHIKTFRCFNSKAFSFGQSEANENEKALDFSAISIFDCPSHPNRGRERMLRLIHLDSFPLPIPCPYKLQLPRLRSHWHHDHLFILAWHAKLLSIHLKNRETTIALSKH
jgi:hypothetical protein